ncbi:MAG: HXXEE domain-containing protein [Ruminococcus sp.]|nr:HXXEE domain-containing protein [Ruminococcus sp.]
MNTLDVLWLSWPWIGFGGGIVILLFLCFTDALRSKSEMPRFRDPVWLSWLMVVAYLIHVCEEYSMHIANGEFELIRSFLDMGVDKMFGGIPLAFFPAVNICLTWIALPAAAVISRKNPVIGLSGIGFLLVNGIAHLGSLFTGSFNPLTSPGSVSGIFIFLPLFAWTAIVCSKDKSLPKKGLAIAIISGAIAHALLFLLYVINKFAGHITAMICIPIVAFSPLIISWLLCKTFQIKTD